VLATLVTGTCWTWNLAFDGSNIWFVDICDRTVASVSSSDAQLRVSTKIAGAPSYLGFDGADIWVGDDSDGSLTRVRASDGARLGNVYVGGRGLIDEPQMGPDDVLHAVTYTNGSPDKLVRIDAAAGVVLDARDLPEGLQKAVVVGGSLWTLDRSTVTERRLSDMSVLRSASVPNAADLIWDGMHLWVASRDLNAVVRL
jgi:hypothetical protein